MTDDRCDCPPCEVLLAAVEEFNRQEWFECHETLEELWVGTEGEIRNFYQGALQVAVALHHWRNGNFGGAVTLLKSGADLLRRVRPVCRSVDVTSLVAGADRMREELLEIGPDRMAEISVCLPKMVLVDV